MLKISTITHLCFADDLVVFTSATPSSLLGLKTTLTIFYNVSGLGVSFAKSEIFCSGVDLDTQTHLAAILGLQRSSLPVRYLGFPLSCKKCPLLIVSPYWIRLLHAFPFGPQGIYPMLGGYN